MNKKRYYIKEHLEVAVGAVEGMHNHIGVFTLSTGENVTVTYTDVPCSELLGNVEELVLKHGFEDRHLEGISYYRDGELADLVIEAIQSYKLHFMNDGFWINPPSFLLGYCSAHGFHLPSYETIWPS